MIKNVCQNIELNIEDLELSAAKSVGDLNIGINDSVANKINSKLLNKNSLPIKKININNQNIVKQLNLTPNIKFLIITNYKKTNKSDLIELLKLNKWSVEKEFYEKEYKTKLLLLKKNIN